MGDYFKRRGQTARRARRGSKWLARIVGVCAVGLVVAGCGGATDPDEPAMSPSASASVATPTTAATPTQDPPSAANPAISAPQASSSQPAVAPSTSASPTPASDPGSGFVAMCPYDNGSGVVTNLPCDSPEFANRPAAPTASPAAITCDTVCTTSGCEQYKFAVLNC